MIEDHLQLLPSLVALVEEESVTRAAQRLGTSQSRMSARLAELRTILGDPILVSASRRRGVMATGRARELAHSARVFLTSVSTAFAPAVFDPATTTRTFSIMANDNAAVIVGVRLVQAIREAAGPSVRLALHSYNANRLDELEDGPIDLVLGSPGQFNAVPALMTRSVVSDSFTTAIRAESAPASVDLDFFCACDHVVVSSDGGGFDGVIDAALSRLGRNRRVVASVQSYLVAIELVASSNLIATLPHALLASRIPHVALKKPPLELEPFTLSAAWHPRTSSDPAHIWLREKLFTLGRHSLVARD